MRHVLRKLRPYWWWTTILALAIPAIIIGGAAIGCDAFGRPGCGGELGIAVYAVLYIATFATAIPLYYAAKLILAMLRRLREGIRASIR